MAKVWKLALSVFIGIDVFVFGYLTLSQLRFMFFGQGQIPGGGSAIDMGIFLLPLFLGWIAGDRLYYFLTYQQRRTQLQQSKLTTGTTAVSNLPANAELGSIWEDDGWDDAKPQKD